MEVRDIHERITLKKLKRLKEIERKAVDWIRASEWAQRANVVNTALNLLHPQNEVNFLTLLQGVHYPQLSSSVTIREGTIFHAFPLDKIQGTSLKFSFSEVFCAQPLTQRQNAALLASQGLCSTEFVHFVVWLVTYFFS